MSINPVTGQDSESHASSTINGMTAAREARSRYLAGILDGSMQLSDVIEYSRSQLNEDAKYLSKLRLFEILRGKPGWNERTAIEALERNGFTKSDNLMSIRRIARRVTLFIELFDTPSERWKARPETPSGWPWFGKLRTLVETAGVSVPIELLDAPEPIEEGDLDDLFGDAPETFEDDLDALLGVD